MNLWFKGDMSPTQLPSQDVDADGRIWTDLARNPDGRVACGWSEAPSAPDFDLLTEMLTWVDGQWGVVALPPVPVSPPEPMRVTKADFQRRLLPAERYAINALRREVAALTAADFLDPANTMLLAVEDVLQAFDLPAEFIEIDHPDTFAGLSLFVHFGALAAERVTEILTP